MAGHVGCESVLVDCEAGAQGGIAMARDGSQALEKGSAATIGIVCAGGARKRAPGVAKWRECDVGVRRQEARLDLFCAGTILIVSSMIR